MVSTITELVATIWTDFLNACATQREKKHKLTPFAMRLHMEERARAQLYEVPNFTTATPNAMFAVKFKGQHGLRTTVVHCSMHHNAIQCDGCSFYKRMRIPCEHINFTQIPETILENYHTIYERHGFFYLNIVRNDDTHR